MTQTWHRSEDTTIEAWEKIGCSRIHSCHHHVLSKLHGVPLLIKDDTIKWSQNGVRIDSFWSQFADTIIVSSLMALHVVSF
jgi:hypothetical protein